MNSVKSLVKTKGYALKALIEDKRSESLITSETCPHTVRAFLAMSWNEIHRETAGFLSSLEEFENNFKPGW